MKKRNHPDENREPLDGSRMRNTLREILVGAMSAKVRQLSSGILVVTAEHAPSSEPERSVLGTCVKDIEAQSPRTVRAKSVFFLTDWSKEPGYAHGADTLVSLGNTARLLLEPGETLAGINAIRWREVLFTNADLVASRDPIADKKGAAIRGQFFTSTGDTINVAAHMNGEEIDVVAPANTAAAAMVQEEGIRREGDGFCVPIIQSDNHPLLEDDAEAGLRFATMADVLNRAIRPVFLDVRPTSDTKAFIAGIKKLDVSVLSRLLAEGGSIFVRDGGQARNGGGGGFTSLCVETTIRDKDGAPLCQGSVQMAFHEERLGGPLYLRERHQHSRDRFR